VAEDVRGGAKRGAEAGRRENKGTHSQRQGVLGAYQIRQHARYQPFFYHRHNSLYH